MPTETLLPTSLEASANFASIALGDVDEDPDSPDAAWAVASGNNVSTSARVGFATPTGNPTGVQTFKIYVRKFSATQSGTPTARIDLYESGSLVATGTAQSVTSATGQMLSQTFDLASTPLSDPTGAGVQALFTGIATGGAPGVRNTVDLGAINWDTVNYSEAGVDAALAQTLPGLGQSVAAEAVASSAVDQSLPKLSSSVEVDVDVTAAVASTLPNLEQAAGVNVASGASARSTVITKIITSPGDVTGPTIGTLSGATYWRTLAIAFKPPVTGVSAGIAQTLPKLSSATTADIVVEGIAASSLPRLAQSVVEGAVVEATVAQSLPSAQTNVAALAGVEASVNAALPHLTQSVSAAAEVAGSAAQNLPKLGQSIVAFVGSSILATIEATLPKLGQDATSESAAEAAIGAVLPRLGQSVGAFVGTAISVSIAQTLPKLGQGLGVEAVVSTSLAASLPKLQSAGTTALTARGVVTQTLPVSLTTLITTVPIVGAIAATLPAIRTSIGMLGGTTIEHLDPVGAVVPLGDPTSVPLEEQGAIVFLGDPTSVPLEEQGAIEHLEVIT